MPEPARTARLIATQSSRLCRQFDGYATLARIGEAGFGLFATDAEAIANMDATGNQLRSALADLSYGNAPTSAASLSVSFGVAIFPFDGRTPEALVESARASQAEAIRSGDRTLGTGTGPQRMH